MKKEKQIPKIESLNEPALNVLNNSIQSVTIINSPEKSDSETSVEKTNNVKYLTKSNNQSGFKGYCY